MKLTPTAAVEYIKNFGLEEETILRVLMTETQRDDVLGDLRQAGIIFSWVPVHIRDGVLKPLFDEIARIDAAITLDEEFPEIPDGESEWFMSIFSRQMGVTLCCPRPTQELFDSYVRRSPGLIPRNVLENPLPCFA